jgi:uncharacterized cupin superfamily protein
VPDTKVLHVSQLPVATGLSADLVHPIKPELFSGKHEAQPGKAVGMTQFGVNHVSLEPGSISALRHWHEAEDELVYVLSGELTLVDENGEHPLQAGCVAGFPAGVPNAHHLVNNSAGVATYLSIGARRPREDAVHYPDDGIGPVRR